MEVEFQGTILPQFRAEIPAIIKPSNTHLGILKVPSAFGLLKLLKNLFFSMIGSLLSGISAMIRVLSCLMCQLVIVRTRGCLSYLSTGCSLLKRRLMDCKGVILVGFLLVKLFLMKNIGCILLFYLRQTAAWLRAEAHWESVSYMRHVDAHKRKYAEEEFYALKRRCSGHDGNSLKCFCLVAVKKEDKKIRRTVLNSVVGTLDLSIRQFLRGEKYPGETKKSSGILARQAPFDAHKYAYIANVCVTKFARRQGIAFNLLYLAIDVATANGMKQLYVHVNIDNKAALDLYAKAGFEIVEAASSTFSEDRRFLMLKVL